MYRAEVINNGGSEFKVRTKDCQFIIDTKGKGCTPPDTLLASLAGCVGVYIRKYAEGSKLDIPNFSVIAEGELSKESPVSFKEINISVVLGGMALDERRINALGGIYP